eukprot:TRINITY_DN4498_c0_g1_i1.p1 TRINITY_DN4498_c0_g1~~TRINITY_DN4498_c0_g1_i1.p1  ORF type:complete len:246 (-),score=40.33 TRINITY_DN4498_c0_g1_i1:97-834(-)
MPHAPPSFLDVVTNVHLHLVALDASILVFGISFFLGFLPPFACYFATLFFAMLSYGRHLLAITRFPRSKDDWVVLMNIDSVQYLMLVSLFLFGGVYTQMIVVPVLIFALFGFFSHLASLLEAIQSPFASTFRSISERLALWAPHAMQIAAWAEIAVAAHFFVRLFTPQRLLMVSVVYGMFLVQRARVSVPLCQAFGTLGKWGDKLFHASWMTPFVQSTWDRIKAILSGLVVRPQAPRAAPPHTKK